MTAINSIPNTNQSTNKAIPAGYHRAQEMLSNYSTRNEFTEAIHTLLSCEEMKMPKAVRAFLTYVKKFIFDKKRIGVLDAKYSTIEQWIGYKRRTVEDIFSWLRKTGIMTSYRTYLREDGSQGHCIKVFAGLGTIQRIVAETKRNFADNLADNLADNFAVCESEENPTESKDESPQKEGDVNTIIKKQIYKNKDINTPIPISSDTTILDKPVKETDLQHFSADLFQSDMPFRIKKYLSRELYDVLEKGFDILEIEQFCRSYQNFYPTKDSDEWGSINESELLYVIKRMVEQVDSVKHSTYKLLERWANDYLVRKCNAINEKWNYTLSEMVLTDDGKVEVQEKQQNDFNNLPSQHDFRTEQAKHAVNREYKLEALKRENQKHEQEMAKKEMRLYQLEKALKAGKTIDYDSLSLEEQAYLDKNYKDKNYIDYKDLDW